MKLQDWLDRNGRSVTWLSAQTGLSISYLSRLIAGERSLSMSTAAKIAAATNNEVTADDWMRQRPPVSAHVVAA